MNNQVFFTGYTVLKKLASIGFLLIDIILSCNCFAQSGAGYISPSGHTLYYKIVPSTNYVLVTYAWNRHSDYPWDGYAKPVGDVVIPTTITMDGATYIVHGVTTKSHDGVKQMFGLHFIKTGVLPRHLSSIYSTLFKRRLSGDYDDMFDNTLESVTEIYPKAQEFIITVKEKVDQWLAENVVE